MAGLPTAVVKLDDGSGTFPYDVSAFVRLTAGVSIARGRGDEFNTVQPSSLTLTFDNTTGVFTLGSGTYGIAIDQRIRVTETVSGAVTRFTGYVQDWPVTWPSGSDQFALAQVTAVDRLSRLARRTLRSVPEQEILADNPLADYPLSEPTGSVSAGSIDGRGSSALILAGSGAAPTFGTNIGLDALTGASFTGGQYLSGGSLVASANLTVEALFIISANPASGANIVQLPDVTGYALSGLSLAVNNAGKLQGLAIQGSTSGPSVASTASVTDGLLHHGALTFDGTTVTLYLDGVSQGTSTVTTTANVTTRINVGGGTYPATTSPFLLNQAAPFTGTICNVAITASILSAGRILGHANSARTGFATDTADQRIARLAGYAGIAVGDQVLEVGQQPSIAPSLTSGQTALDAIQAVATAEGGLVFFRGDGKLVLQNKEHRPFKALGAASVALTADQINPDATVGGAKNYLVNTATGSRNNGAVQRSVNATSVTAYDEYSSDLSRALLPSDPLMLDVLTWTTGVYGTPRPRLPSFTLDLLTLPNATAQAVLALEIGDLITISGMPSQTPASLGSLVIEGWTETLTHNSWEITFNTVPAAVFYAPIVDTAGATVDSGYPVYF